MRGFKLAAAAAAFAIVTGPAAAQESILKFFEGFGSAAQSDEPQVPLPELTEAAPDLPGLAGSLLGAWAITTDRENARCSLDGSAQIRATEAGGYTCELVMRDYCEGSWDGIMRQSCEIQVSGSTIHIQATLLESLNGASMSGYAPDDFVLEPADDGTLIGRHDGWGGYPAIWRRTVDGIS